MQNLLSILLAIVLASGPALVFADADHCCVSRTAGGDRTAESHMVDDACCPGGRQPEQRSPDQPTPDDESSDDCDCVMSCCHSGKTIAVPSPTRHAGPTADRHVMSAPTVVFNGSPHLRMLERPPRHESAT